MNDREVLAKSVLMKKLSKQGYVSYARLLEYFDIKLVSEDNFVAAMEPDRGKIIINELLDADQVSVAVRHEILHEYLQHKDRLVKHLGGIDAYNKAVRGGQEFNIAGDYEISNRAYTDADKAIVRNFLVNGKKFRGLVTDDDHPEWVDYTMEQMYDELMKARNNQQGNNGQNDSGDQGGDSGSGAQGQGGEKKSKEYIAGWKKAIEDYKSGKLAGYFNNSGNQEA